MIRKDFIPWGDKTNELIWKPLPPQNLVMNSGVEGDDRVWGKGTTWPNANDGIILEAWGHYLGNKERFPLKLGIYND